MEGEEGREGGREKGRIGQTEREREAIKTTLIKIIHSTYHKNLLEVTPFHSKCLMLSCPQCSYGVDLTELECGDGA